MTGGKGVAVADGGAGGLSSLGHRPTGRWEFDGAVAACFDDMLARSVPDLAGLRRACLALGGRYVRPGAPIVDLGCSRGGALAPFVAAFPDSPCLGVEASAPMRRACRARFAGEIAAGRVQVTGHDLRGGYPDVRGVGLTLCVLTLQFVPVEHRQRLLRGAWERTAPGGALLLAAKVLGATAALDGALVSCHHGFKRAGGYTAGEIAAKRRSLEGALVPLTARWNEELLARAGFASAECFWRCLNFAAWVAVKEGA